MRIWLAARRPDLYKNPSELKRKVKAAFLQFSRIWKRRVKPNAQRADCENAVRNSSQPALQIRYPPRKWRRSHGDVASTKTKDFIAICQSTRPVRDTDQCKAEGS